MADTSTLGSMLQGVSQQPPHIRGDGRNTLQDNFLSHTTRGLTSRPGTAVNQRIIGLPLDMKFTDFKLGGEVFQLGTKAGVVHIVNEAGFAQVINATPEALEYIGDDMVVYVYDNKETAATFLLNRDKVTALETDTSEQEAMVVGDIGLVTSLGGLFSHTYTVHVETEDGTVITGTYEAPDGLEDGDASRTTSDYIVSQLAISLNAGALPAGATVTAANSVLMIQGIPNVRISTEDGAGGDTLVYQTNVSKSTEELANHAPHGTLVRVVGLDGTEDDFYMRFEVAEEDTVGEGFGSEGLWREWYNPYEPTRFDASTMPHSITREDDGSFTIAPAEWLQRRTGDADSNPAPGFIGKAIRDVNGFQSRVVTIAGPVTNMSVTNSPFDFFKQSAVAEIATDPIEIISTAPKEFTLQYIVPFDRDLVIFGDENQFHIAGGTGLTSANAGMSVTTSYEMAAGTRPFSTGRTVLFPFTVGTYSGIKEFYSSNTVDANSAVSITENLPEYITGNVTDIQISTNFNIAFIRTDDPAHKNRVWVYKYLWDGENKIQSSWSRWDMASEVVNVYFNNSRVFMLLYDGIDHIQVTVDLELPDTPTLGYSLAIDEYETKVIADTYTDEHGDVYTSVTLPYSNAVFVQSLGCRIPGQELSNYKAVTSGSGTTYSFPSYLAPVGATVYVGKPFTSKFKPTMPFIRDGRGAVMRFIKLVVTRFVIHFDESGPMTAIKSSRMRSQDTRLSNAKAALSLNPDDPARISLSSGKFEFPFGERSDLSELTIEASGPRPITINEIEWVGQSRGGKRRV